MKRYYFTKEELFHLESINAKRNNLVLQETILKREAEGVISSFCKRNSINAEQRVKFSINLKEGFIEIEESRVPGKKKTKGSNPVSKKLR